MGKFSLWLDIIPEVERFNQLIDVGQFERYGTRGKEFFINLNSEFFIQGFQIIGILVWIGMVIEVQIIHLVQGSVIDQFWLSDI